MNMIESNSNSEPFARNPDEVTDFDLKSEIITLNNLLHQLDHHIGELTALADSNNIKLELLEEAVSRSTYLPYLPANLRYSHKTNILLLHKRLRIPFKGNEAELLSHIFAKSSGKPRRKKYYCSEVADDLSVIRKKNRDEGITAKSVHQTITRIRDRLELEHRAGGILKITSKEFYFTII